MTEREKKLLIFLGGTLFIILNLIALNQFYLPKVQSAKSAKDTAEIDLTSALSTLELEEEIGPEMDWVEESGTAKTNHIQARSQLQLSLRKEADRRRLDFLDSDILGYQEGNHFGRVKVSFKATGMERDVISWLTAVHRVEQRQVVTLLEIKPKNNDPTQVEFEVEVEKWIIPADDI